jgi:peptidylprolyl isomerase
MLFFKSGETMKFRLMSAVLAPVLATGAIAQTAPAAKPAAPVASASLDKAALAYALGYDFGRGLADQAPGLDVMAINRAVQDGYAKKQPSIAPDKLQATVVAYQKQREAQLKAEFDRISRENKVKSDAALASNKTKPGVITLPNGIQYKVVEAGAGAKPTASSIVEFNFSGALAATGQVFVSTFANVKPVTGKLSDVANLPGMLEIMQQMPTGARWQVLLPPEKAWGNGPESLRGGPGPNQAIFLDIKLISVK